MIQDFPFSANKFLTDDYIRVKNVKNDFKINNILHAITQEDVISCNLLHKISKCNS